MSLGEVQYLSSTVIPKGYHLAKYLAFLQVAVALSVEASVHTAFLTGSTLISSLLDGSAVSIGSSMQGTSTPLGDLLLSHSTQQQLGAATKNHLQQSSEVTYQSQSEVDEVTRDLVRFAGFGNSYFIKTLVSWIICLGKGGKVSPQLWAFALHVLPSSSSHLKIFEGEQCPYLDKLGKYLYIPFTTVY
jgi:hypothetical protein